MEVGRRISASPRPCSGRRVVARKKRAAGDGFVNSVKKLQRREISSKRDRAFGMSNAQERFRNMHLMVCFHSFLFSLVPNSEMRFNFNFFYLQLTLGFFSMCSHCFTWIYLRASDYWFCVIVLSLLTCAWQISKPRHWILGRKRKCLKFPAIYTLALNSLQPESCFQLIGVWICCFWPSSHGYHPDLYTVHYLGFVSFSWSAPWRRPCGYIDNLLKVAFSYGKTFH